MQKKMDGIFFENNNLYDFDKCEQALENDSREVYKGIKLLRDHVFYLNYSQTSNKKRL